MAITIRVKRNGPYMIALEDAGQVPILDAEGKTLVPEAGRSIVLCRCGASSTKPFCDKSHRTVGFVGDECAPALDPPPSQPA